MSLPVTAVVAGGVLGVLHLDRQPLVRRVEFLHREENAEHLLCAAANAASQSFEWHNDQWLNNDIQYFVTLTWYCTRYSVYNEALQQNIVMWQMPGVLKLIAAPWKWQLHNKLTRLIRIYNRDEDFEDAISLVHIMTLQRGTSLTATEIEAWDYGRDRPLFITPQLLATIQVCCGDQLR